MVTKLKKDFFDKESKEKDKEIKKLQLQIKELNKQLDNDKIEKTLALAEEDIFVKFHSFLHNSSNTKHVDVEQ